MTTRINPQVLKEVIYEFPNRFSSVEVCRNLRQRGYNYNTKTGLLAYYFREFGFINEKKSSKMWIKNPNLLQQFRDPNYLSNGVKVRLEQFTDDEVLADLKRRGYTGTLNPPSKSIIL